MYTNDDEDDDMARVGPLVLAYIGLMLNAKASTLSRKINNGLKTNIAAHIRTNIINVRIETYTYIAHSSVFFFRSLVAMIKIYKTKRICAGVNVKINLLSLCDAARSHQNVYSLHRHIQQICTPYLLRCFA